MNNRLKILGKSFTLFLSCLFFLFSCTAIAETVIYVNGDTVLKLQVEFEPNLFFSTYDVDVYIDDQYIATIDHGESLEGLFSVSEGAHNLLFTQHGDISIYGKTQLIIEGATRFSCTIRAHSDMISLDEIKTTGLIVHADSSVENIDINNDLILKFVLDYNAIAEYPLYDFSFGRDIKYYAHANDCWIELLDATNTSGVFEITINSDNKKETIEKMFDLLPSMLSAIDKSLSESDISKALKHFSPRKGASYSLGSITIEYHTGVSWKTPWILISVKGYR